MKNPLKNIGPGTLVAAAFIGPGTVTVCTIAGVTYGFTLLWAMLLSIVATIVLQEMAARLGLVGGKGLAETVKNQIPNKVLRVVAMALILSAIVIGNTAYEAGNISGGVLGLDNLVQLPKINLSIFSVSLAPLLLGVIAASILFIGNYKAIEKILVGLVLVMSVSFIIAAFLTAPSSIEIIKGLFIPKVPEQSILTIIALIGTTVVPYNLFLHASLVKEKWQGVNDLQKARNDIYISIALGGLVSMAIIICGAAIQGSEVRNASDLAKGLAPLFGDFSKYFLGIGLFAAGITSAITAPLAAAYVVRDVFGWKVKTTSTSFRAVWGFVLGIGVLFSSVGFKAIEIIQFAQVANGLLLPIIAVFLVWVVNKKAILGNQTNSVFQNVVGVCIILATFLLAGRTFLNILGW